MEFDSGGNDVRIRTGKTLGLGKAPLIGVRRDSNVSSDKNQNLLRVHINQVGSSKEPLISNVMLTMHILKAIL